MDIRGVDFVVHYVRDLKEAVSFYRDILDLKLELHNPEWNWAEFSVPPITLVLFGAYEGAPLANGKGGCGLSLAVNDFDAAIEELRRKGVEVEWGPNELSHLPCSHDQRSGGNPIFLHRRKDGSWG